MGKGVSSTLKSSNVILEGFSLFTLTVSRKIAISRERWSFPLEEPPYEPLPGKIVVKISQFHVKLNQIIDCACLNIYGKHHSLNLS